MLETGANIYELRASTTMPSDQTKGIQEAKATLHAKVFAVDRERIFIGSFNWNQRSVNLDTELGVIIHSPEMAHQKGLIRHIPSDRCTNLSRVSLPYCYPSPYGRFAVHRTTVRYRDRALMNWPY
jgi:hypothetical protein